MSFKIGDVVTCNTGRPEKYTVVEIGAAGTSMKIALGGLEDKYWYKQADFTLNKSASEPLSVGVKHDQGKAPVSLIPVEAIIQEADVFAYGAKKYSKHNFRKGMDWTRPADAAIRHMLAWISGESTDAETGKSHLAHARCCLAMLIFYETNNVGNDDRYKGESDD